MNQHCENCNTEIHKGTFNSVSKTKPEITDFIHQFTDNKSVGFCTKCYVEPFKNAQENYLNQKAQLDEDYKNQISKIEPLLSEIPIITLHNPQNWEYDIFGIVTAQSVSGTGLVAEMSANWTDFFGMESKTYNQKLKESEDKCQSRLRFEAVMKGGNAIIGTDIDYSEAGGGKGMLMVCFSGTVIKLKNYKALGYNAENFEKIDSLAKDIKRLSNQVELFGNFKSVLPYFTST